MKENLIVNDILTYVENNLDNDLSLEKIANELNYSKFHINRLFLASTGLTIYKYIQRRRLTKAAWKLAETNMPIIDIAFEASYTSQQAFTQAFHQLYLCTPQVYRKNGVFNPKQAKISMSLVVYKANSMLGGRRVA